MMLITILLNVFVYLPAALFYLLIGACIWSYSGEKKHRERHEDDGK